jgi:hypothetical protein
MEVNMSTLLRRTIVSTTALLAAAAVAVPVVAQEGTASQNTLVGTVPLLAAGIAAVASVGAAFVSGRYAHRSKRYEHHMRKSQDETEFIREQLTNLYVPVSMSLHTTRILFERRFEGDVSAAEKEAIEHEWYRYNQAIRDAIMEGSHYLEPTPEGHPATVEELVARLLEHYTQWEIVYKLKYEYEAYDGSVFAGIDRFGFRKFPSELEVDEYFETTTERLREELHRKLLTDRSPRRSLSEP